MAVSDPDAGKVVATPAIGAGSDGAAFDPGTGYAFSSNGDGTLTIVQQTGGKWDVAREHRDRARRADDRGRREDAQASTCRRATDALPAGGADAPRICRTLQGAGRRQMTRGALASRCVGCVVGWP